MPTSLSNLHRFRSNNARVLRILVHIAFGLYHCRSRMHCLHVQSAQVDVHTQPVLWILGPSGWKGNWKACTSQPSVLQLILTRSFCHMSVAHPNSREIEDTVNYRKNSSTEHLPSQSTAPACLSGPCTADLTSFLPARSRKSKILAFRESYHGSQQHSKNRLVDFAGHHTSLSRFNSVLIISACSVGGGHRASCMLMRSMRLEACRRADGVTWENNSGARRRGSLLTHLADKEISSGRLHLHLHELTALGSSTAKNAVQLLNL